MKHFITIFSLLIGLNVIGQTIQNRGFEDWTVDSTLCPTAYECTNEQLFGSGIEPVVRTTASHTGTYALSLVTHITSTDTFFGYILKGDVDNQTGGVAYSNRPDSLVGYANYNIMPGDTALILAVFRKSGFPIGTCIGNFVGTQMNYGRFSFAIDWQGPSSIMPDSMIFAAASSNALNEIGIAHGSKLVLDDVGFVGSGTVAQPPNNGFENWTTIKSEKPAKWSTFLDYPFAFKYDLVNRLTDRSKINSGSSAIEIKTDIIDGDTLLGYLNNYTDEIPGGYAYTKQIDTLTGFYQFQSPGTDSGTVAITLHKGAQQYHKGVRLPPVSSYTEFNLPFNCPFQPDSIRISFIAGTEFNHSSIVKGSVLWIDDIDFKICDVPAKPSGFVGKTELCNTSGTVAYSVQMQSDAANYSWNLPVGFSITSSPADSNAVEVTLDSALAGSGVIEVSANVYCGSSAFESHQIDVDTTPTKPVINGWVSLDAGATGDKYLWFINGVLSTEDTTKVLDVPSKEKVIYTVVVINGNCASDTSDKYYHSPGSVYEKSIERRIAVFPNPTNGIITIQFENKPLVHSVKVYSLVGKLEMVTNNSSEIDLSTLPAGVYILQVELEDQLINQRVIKR